MRYIRIDLDNVKMQLSGDGNVLAELRKLARVRHPQAFFITKQSTGPRVWDGYVYAITEYGYSATGFLPWILSLVPKDVKVQMVDKRTTITPKHIPTHIGDLTLRKYQKEAISAVANNYLGDDYFPRGMIQAATNAGKTALMVGLYKSFKKANCLVLINDSELYNQFKKEIPELLDKDEVGYARGKEFKEGAFMFAMVQTLASRLKKSPQLGRYISEKNMVLVDECDLSDNKTYKYVLSFLKNAYVRVGLSGTVMIKRIARKNEVKNQNLRGYFGNVLYTITNKQLIDMKISSNVVVKIVAGNNRLPRTSEYAEEYRMGITENKQRHQIIADRVSFNLKEDRYPILIVCKYHEHVNELYKKIKEDFGWKYTVARAHHKTPNKTSILAQFAKGDIDILIASHIVKRGKNYPKIKLLINASGGDGPEDILQIAGRALRTDDSKNKTYIEDLYDQGEHLKRHSAHRVSYYKNEGFKVISLF